MKSLAGFSVAIALAVTVCTAGCGGCGGGIDGMIDTWADRADKFAESVSADDEDGVLVFSSLAIMHAERGDAEKALAASGRIVNHELSDSMVVGLIAIYIGQHLDEAAAKEFLESVENVALREDAASSVALVQAGNGDYEAAKRTTGRIASVEGKNEAWLMIAMGMRGRKDFDAAREALQNVDPQNKNDRRKIAGLARSLDKLESGEIKFGVKKKVLTSEEALRKVENADDEDSSANAWRDVAKAYLREGNEAECRGALSKAETAGEGIKWVSMQCYLFGSIGEVYLELDDPAEANRVARKGLVIAQAHVPEDNPLAEITYMIDQFMGGEALLIDILARSGDLEKASELAEQTDKWPLLGAACAKGDLLKELEELMEQIESPRDKSLICAGVVKALIKRKKEESEGSDDES